MVLIQRVMILALLILQRKEAYNLARVHGPLFSLDASGQVGKDLVYATWKGVSYVREYIIPPNPKTAPQVVIRDYFKMAVAAWQAETAPNRLLWTNYAKGASLQESGFNLYVGKYIDFLIANSGTPPTVTNTPPTIS